MLRRSTKIQLILFVIITLVGVSYVSAEYVGLAKNILGNDGCTVKANFPDSGGIFTNAEVTYRGVTVGKVGTMRLIRNGVQVDLQLDDCNAPRVPINSKAVVANRSVVGEQYVNLIPASGSGQAGPFVHGSDVVLPMSRNSIPTATKTLLVNLDRLINSIPLDALRTTVNELDLAVNNRGSDLGRLLDASDTLLRAALQPQNVDNTIALIENSATVLQTQLDEQDPLRSWTRSLNLLSAQLKTSDPDIRRLFDESPAALNTVQTFVRDNRTDLGIVLANLSVTGSQVIRHLDGVEQVLELYPALAAGGASVLRKSGTAQLGLILSTKPGPTGNQDPGNNPRDCGDPTKAGEGYNGVKRPPSDLTPIAPDVSAQCTAPLSSGTNVRGSAHVPGGDPISVSGGGYAYPRVQTTNTLGDTLQKPNALGDASWLTLLTDGLH
ncbi:MCE family protein [uncultured Jatrophihabitans sp.]|uniref:MCE family protein n=1 Tax=uncultured Jatrophihabitans sp. TaxID=1610747 RepID=UPI0035C96036